MATVFVEQFIASQTSEPEQLVLDFDATEDLVHGWQENRFFHGYYDSYCFLPLYVFCNDQLLVAYLRPSKIDAAKHSAAIVKLLVQRFRQVWPKVRIILWADSGFGRWKLLRWCDRHQVDYIIGLAPNRRILAKAECNERGDNPRFFADRTSCHRFLANQLRLLLSSAAYVLVEPLRRLGLSGTELAHAQAGTI